MISTLSPFYPGNLKSGLNLAYISSVFFKCLNASARVTERYVRFQKKVEELRLPQVRSRRQGLLSLLSPIFLCHKINDGGRSNTIINKRLSPTLKMRLHRNLDNGWLSILIGHFRAPQIKPHFQNEAKCRTFCTKSHFHIKSFALTLVCKDR